MNRLLIALGITLVVLPFVVMAGLTRLLPEEGLATMSEEALYQTRTYTYAVYALIVMITGVICALVGAVSLTLECHRDNVRRYCGGQDDGP